MKVVRVLGREGISGVEDRLKQVQSDPYARSIGKYRGLSSELLEGLIAAANVFLRLNQWWSANETRRRLSERVVGVVRGDTKASRRLTRGALRVHIDEPQIGLINIVKGACAVSGWAVDLEAHSAAKVRIVVGKVAEETRPQPRDDVQRAFAAASDLPRDTGFDRVLMLPVGLSRMRIEVEGPDGSWIPVRRALFLRVPGRGPARRTESGLSYSDWTRLEQRQLKAAIPGIKRHIAGMVHRPTFTVLVDTRQTRRPGRHDRCRFADNCTHFTRCVRSAVRCQLRCPTT